MKKIPLIALLLSISTAAHATRLTAMEMVAKQHWVKTPDATISMTKAKAECKFEAEKVVSSMDLNPAALETKDPATGLPEAFAETKQMTIFDSCMKAKGFKDLDEHAQ